MRIPLIMIPGLVCDERLFSHQIESLSDVASCTVVDHRHHDDIKALAAHILEHAPERFALLGLSMGGYVSFEIMRQAPDRVMKLALLATSARPDTEESAKMRTDMINLAGRGKFRGLSPALVRSFLHPANAENQALVELLFTMAQDTGADGFIHQQRTILSRKDSRDLLPRISCPTMVIFGDEDPRTPLDPNREIADLIPTAELVVLSDCGHLPPLEKPAETSAHLRRWLLA